MKKEILISLVLLLTIISCSKDDSEEIDRDFIIGNVTDIDGNIYETIVIGDQTWMAENLKVTHYADGTSIPLVEENSAWASLGENNDDKGYCYYDNDQSEYSDYGALYTYAAAINGIPYEEENSQGVCPDGWHVPNKEEWLELVNYVGTVEDAGMYLKESGTSHWIRTIKDVKNEYYFNALPGGNRYLYDGVFDRIGSTGYWWSSTQNTEADAIGFSFGNSTIGAYYSRYGKSYGFSVRCLMD